MADKLTPAQEFAQAEEAHRKKRQALTKQNREARAAGKAERAKAQKKLEGGGGSSRQAAAEEPAAGGE